LAPIGVFLAFLSTFSCKYFREFLLARELTAGPALLPAARFGLFAMPERPANRPSLAWSPVADIVSATLRALFSDLSGLSRCIRKEGRSSWAAAGQGDKTPRKYLKKFSKNVDRKAKKTLIGADSARKHGRNNQSSGQQGGTT
jgi:hypothetical protein